MEDKKIEWFRSFLLFGGEEIVEREKKNWWPHAKSFLPLSIRDIIVY